ncbi:purine and uridine phosphorylase [Melanomma pulvis-pyrius CBS 109.77]|uniref:Purine and uridine phosphorylase n=1 Tax=Melanomma pulvis-pyrius CBS 109.77 TaxID=1314802 RepID=A0A6A6X0P5_9PLEO|nr:purine and uridine phosphorylase [Melanomma pulvis-pyrius CBS 109.77]
MSAGDYYQQTATEMGYAAPSKYAPKDYTVGIICALSKEKAAAECFLDVEHPQTKAQPRGDNNAYTLGAIGPHNVVIASLPEGRYGTTNAAAVARDMIRTFPKIRFGLMVGIGGGAPTAKHDIRLGDIVVAVPDSSRNEVLKYDFGKTVQEKAFQRAESMNNCPPLLKSVVSALKTKYKRKGHPLQEYIENALKTNQRLRNEYQKPDPSTDVLYRPDYVHPEAADVCSQMCASKPEHMMPRPIPFSLEKELLEEMHDPTIHYGPVASGNQLMKDARLRDSLAHERGVLCFEMEASGLMEHFPSLVIRGICDYSDTHKNDHWQGYAAMVKDEKPAQRAITDTVAHWPNSEYYDVRV